MYMQYYNTVYTDCELQALYECAKNIYLNHSVEINKLQQESDAIKHRSDSLLYNIDYISRQSKSINERFSKTIEAALLEEGMLLQEGIFDFLKGVFRAFLSLFGIGVEEKEKEVTTRYVTSINKKLAADVPEGQSIPTWEKLKPKDVKRDFGIVANYGQAMADDAITKASPAVDKFISLNIAPIPPTSNASANVDESLIIEQADKDPYADNKEDLKALSAAAGQIRGAISTIAPFNKNYDALVSEFKANPANAPIDLMQQIVIGTKALLPITTKKDLANGIIGKGTEYITDAGASTAGIDSPVAISTTLGGDTGEAAASANQVDENDLRDAAAAATEHLERGAEEVQGGLIDKMKLALQKWLEASGITDPCAYVEENRGELEGELNTLESGMAKVKSSGMGLNDKLKTLGTMLGGFGAASFPAAAMAAAETGLATAEFVVMNPLAAAKAGASGAGIIQHATVLGMKAASWMTLGKVMLVTAAMILVYRYLLKEGYLCTLKDLVSGIAKPLAAVVGPRAREVLSGVAEAVQGWANKVWSKLRGKKNEARIAIAHEILLEEFGMPNEMPVSTLTVVDDYRNTVNTAALEWIETHDALNDCLASVDRMCNP